MIGRICSAACRVVFRAWWLAAIRPRPFRALGSASRRWVCRPHPPRVRSETSGSETSVPTAQARKIVMPPLKPAWWKTTRAPILTTLASTLRSNCRMPTPMVNTAWSSTSTTAISAVPAAKPRVVSGVATSGRRLVAPKTCTATSGTMMASTALVPPAVRSDVRTRTRRSPWSVSGRRAISRVPSPSEPSELSSSIIATAAPATPTSEVTKLRAASVQKPSPRMLVRAWVPTSDALIPMTFFNPERGGATGVSTRSPTSLSIAFHPFHGRRGSEADRREMAIDRDHPVPGAPATTSRDTQR